MKLLFVRKPHVYLPEVTAYKAYLAANHSDVQAFESTDLDEYDPNDYDVVWHFMGRDIKGEGRYVVHEYNSLSTQPLATLKNQVKRLTNARPDKRIFLNDIVHEAFGFHDNVPKHFRDMGVDQIFFETNRSSAPEYDFVYAGGLNRGPIIKRFLDYFALNMRDTTLLLVGDASQALQQRYSKASNITFKGRVPYLDIPSNIANARFGLNIMPNIRPFNIQTATKVLEYCAVGLPVVTTNYKWIQNFENTRDANFFKLDNDMSNLSKTALEQHDFRTPNISNLSWDHIIGQSGIFDFLKTSDKSNHKLQ